MNTAFKCADCGKTVRGWLSNDRTLMDGGTVVATIHEGKVVCVPLCAIPCRYCGVGMKGTDRQACENCEDRAHRDFERKVRM